MLEKFKTLFSVKSSLISLYFALTIPIPIISSEQLRIPSIIAFLIGTVLIICITNDYVETCEKKISYRTSFVSSILGKGGWEIYWSDIKSIKSLPTSQGSKVFYFETSRGKSFLVPQRVENLEKLIENISNKTGLDVNNLCYLSPLWTYKLLTLFSSLMIIGELISFFSKYYQY